jgi:hypothetical protein
LIAEWLKDSCNEFSSRGRVVNDEVHAFTVASFRTGDTEPFSWPPLDGGDAAISLHVDPPAPAGRGWRIDGKRHINQPPANLALKFLNRR